MSHATPQHAGPAATHQGSSWSPPARRQPTSLLHRAAAEPATGLPGPLRSTMRERFGHDFGHVRIHSGAASREAAERLGARAYTLGRDVHLGNEARQLDAAQRDRLLVHEAIHTVQQGAAAAAPSPSLRVSVPTDTAEQEAHTLSDSIAGDSGPAPLRRSITHRAAPHVQRDLKAEYAVKDGKFKTDLTTESHPGANCGMSGTIKFTPSATSPDSSKIRLLQVVRLEDLTTAADYVWTGGEADRNSVTTTADPAKGVQPGFFVDHAAAAATPRTAKADPKVSPYYREYWPNAATSQDGKKAGASIQEASLWDYPGWTSKCRFTFETAAKAVNSGYVYASLKWGFTISDPAAGTVTNEHAAAERSPSTTLGAAVRKFDEFYKNPGASTAP